MTVKKAHFNDKVWIDEQTQTKGPLRATSDAYAEGWERTFATQETHNAEGEEQAEAVASDAARDAPAA